MSFLYLRGSVLVTDCILFAVFHYFVARFVVCVHDGIVRNLSPECASEGCKSYNMYIKLLRAANVTKGYNVVGFVPKSVCSFAYPNGCYTAYIGLTRVIYAVVVICSSRTVQ